MGVLLSKPRTSNNSLYSLIDFCIYIFETIIIIYKITATVQVLSKKSPDEKYMGDESPRSTC